MTADDLSAPLGMGKPKRRRVVVPPVVPRAVAGALGLCLVVFALWVVLVDDPFGGEPVAMAPIELRAPGQADKIRDAAQGTKPPAATAEAPEKGTKPSGRTVTIIDGLSGKRQDVVVGDASPSAPGRASVDQRLIEPSRHGAIPKIGPDGARAADVYARPVKSAADGPRVAILVGGLGIGASGTSEALAKLPGAVTLGFAPYGNDLERLVARARGDGREIVLQVPMEPVDYPFAGYVGIANYMGARFTAAEQALTPVMRDAGKRGLIYVDDGTSTRSLTSQVAGASNMPFAKATIVLDAVPTPIEIDNALTRLEALARERGVAIGVATALPASIDRIAQWAKGAEGRGVVLVPISAVASKPKSS